MSAIRRALRGTDWAMVAMVLAYLAVLVGWPAWILYGLLGRS